MPDAKDEDALIVSADLPVSLTDLEALVEVGSTRRRSFSEISGHELDIMTGRKPRQRLVRDKGRPNKAEKKAIKRNKRQNKESAKETAEAVVHANDDAGLSVLSFDSKRMEAITTGVVPMTASERAFLIVDTARFEECQESTQQLAEMNDSDLMSTAYATWAEYASGQV